MSPIREGRILTISAVGTTQGTTGWLQCTGTLVVAKWQPGATIVNVTALARMTTMVVVKEMMIYIEIRK